jgi:hypothetical protein
MLREGDDSVPRRIENSITLRPTERSDVIIDALCARLHASAAFQV